METCKAFTVLIVLATSLVFSVNGLDLRRALKNENMPCFVPRKTAPVNVTWLTSVPTWYYPIMSVLDLYLEGIELSGKRAIELREDELYYDACITYNLGGGTQATVRGFGDQERTVQFEPINGFEEFKWYVTRPGSSHGGITYTTLTDNSTFHVSTTCQEGRMTWGAISTVKSLPPETVNQIKRHVLSNGFKRRHFTGFRYDACPNSA